MWIYSTAILKKRKVFYGSNDWKNIVLSELAMITEKFPPAIPSVLSGTPLLLGNGTYNRGSARAACFLWLAIWDKGEADVSGSLIPTQTTSLIVLFTYHRRNWSVQYLKVKGVPLTSPKSFWVPINKKLWR